MEPTTKLVNMLSKLNAELISKQGMSGRIEHVAIFPKDPGPTVRSLMSDVHVVIGLKPSTMNTLGKLLGEVDSEEPSGYEDNGSTQKAFKKWDFIQNEDNRVEVDVRKADVSQVWSEICEALTKDGWAMWWKFGDLVYDPAVVKEIVNRPSRTTQIDLVDVMIEIEELTRTIRR